MWGRVAAVAGCLVLGLVACEGEHRPYVIVSGSRPGAGPDAGSNGSMGAGSPSECRAGADGTCSAQPTLQRGALCSTDADCRNPFPSCVGSLCTCALSAAQLEADARNCGACGNDCSLLSGNASCEQGRCALPGEPKPNDVAQSPSGSSATLGLVAASGAVLKSPKYSLQVSVGQAPGGNAVLRSNRYQLRGGVVGASR